MVMDRFLKCIGLCIVALALWYGWAGCGSSTGSADDKEVALCSQPVYHQGAEEYSFSGMSVSCPNAELAENTGRVQFLNSLRIQRLSLNEYLSTLKSWGALLAQRFASLSQHREKQVGATVCTRESQVCDYYVFALRKILI